MRLNTIKVWFIQFLPRRKCNPDPPTHDIGLLLAFCIGCFLLIPAPAYSDKGDTETQHQLEELRQKIFSIKQKLDDENSEKQGVLSELRKTDFQIATLVRDISKIDKSILTTHKKLNQLETQINDLIETGKTHKNLLRDQVRAAYLIGKREYFKLMLNQENPATSARILTYYDYFYRARAAVIEEINDNTKKLSNYKTELEAQQTTLKRLKLEKSQTAQQLQVSRLQQKSAVKHYQQSISEKNQQLQTLQIDEAQLLNLLNELTQLPPSPPAAPISKEILQRPFVKLKGQLQWPTEGGLAAKFGTVRPSSSVKWKGVVIESEMGKPVYAVAAGRIVFADWLRGFGFLIIIDHGDNYMSLYGYNQVLYKSVGESVAANDVIAEVGDSGGQQVSGLYFEIRHNGVPQNPGKWCRQRKSLLKSKG